MPDATPPPLICYCGLMLPHGFTGALLHHASRGEKVMVPSGLLRDAVAVIEHDRIALAAAAERERELVAANAELLGFRDMLSMWVDGWRNGFPTPDGSMEDQLFERAALALAVPDAAGPEAT